MPAVNHTRLRDRRDELDVSNSDLANQVGIAKKYLENILYGLDRPSGRVVHRLARALDLPVDQIAIEPAEQVAAPKPKRRKGIAA